MLRLVTAFLAISTGSLLGQSEATDWKRVEVLE